MNIQKIQFYPLKTKYFLESELHWCGVGSWSSSYYILHYLIIVLFYDKKSKPQSAHHCWNLDVSFYLNDRRIFLHYLERCSSRDMVQQNMEGWKKNKSKYIYCKWKNKQTNKNCHFREFPLRHSSIIYVKYI